MTSSSSPEKRSATLFLERLSVDLPQFVRQLRRYLRDPATEAVLHRVLRGSVTAAYRSYIEVVAKERGGEWVSKEMPSVIVVAQMVEGMTAAGEGGQKEVREREEREAEMHAVMI